MSLLTLLQNVVTVPAFVDPARVVVAQAKLRIVKVSRVRTVSIAAKVRLVKVDP